jgi:tetratricopeptide (TPR) repeat protein
VNDSAGAWLRRYAQDGDPAHLTMAIRVGRRTGSAADTAEAWLERYRLRGRTGDLDTAITIVQDALRRRPDPIGRAALLRQRAACHHERYVAGAGRPALRHARTDYEKALELLPGTATLRSLILNELGTVLQDQFDVTDDPADIDRAVDLGQQAVAADPDGPDTAGHLVNLGTARFTRYEATSDSDDLDAALDCWNRAIGLLPQSSPFRAAFHDRLTIGHLARAQSSDDDTDDDLTAAVGHGRLAVRLRATAIHAGHLAEALIERWNTHRDRTDLDEAVTVCRGALTGRDRSPDLLANYAHTLVDRYQETGDAADLDAAFDTLRQVRHRPPSVRSAAARALTMRYLARGDVADLTRAVREARATVTATLPGDVTYASRTARLSQLLFMRYRRTGRHTDLDAAIDAMRTPQTSTQLNQLAGFLSERYERDGRTADRAAALDNARRAETLGAEPTVTAGLASTVHDTFVATGRWDDLTASIAQHRAALAAAHPQAPTYYAMLGNLAMALQDRHAHDEQPATIDEAIELHERALAAAGPDSPERPGLLGALAGALKQRYEHTGTPADLQRAIVLGRQALDALHARSPERARLLAALAAALHLDDRFDQAADAYRRALRCVGRNGAVRAGMRHDYAVTLAALGRAAAEREFRTASAEATTPVARLDAAAGWGAWAARTGRWQQAATAFAAAGAAHWEILGAHQSHAHRSRWLDLRTEITVGEAYARLRSGEPGRAVAALDGGRALTMSEQLEARTTAARLRAAGHRDLADRYEQASRRYADLAESPQNTPGLTAGLAADGVH